MNRATPIIPRSFAAHTLLVSVLAASLEACGGGGSAPALPSGQFELQTRVEPGQEVHRCQFVKLPKDAAFVVGASHSYTTGSHHMLLFRTDLASIPAELSGLRDCYESGAGMMSHVRGAIYAAQTPTGDVTYPPGVGLEVKSEEVLLMQAHYINASERALDAKVSVSLKLAPRAAVQQRAGVFFFYNPFIHVPPQSVAKASMRCLIRNEVTILGAASHYHKRGESYAAYLDPSLTELAAAPFYTSDDWAHPRPLNTPTLVAAGSRLRFECNYDNRAGTATYLQGQSAELNEMCMFMGLYYPAMERADELCQTSPDRFGVGAKSCIDSSLCLQACPAGSAPLTLGSGDLPAVHECWQRCMSASCPNATTAILANLRCARVQCGTECLERGASCTSCLVAHCAAEVNACAAATCQ